MHDAIVIGAGIGGLSAAISLAAAGKRVKVFESAPDVGGKAGVVTIDGVEADTGPTVLTMPRIFEELLGLAGMRLSEEAPLHRPEPFFRYLWPDGQELDVHGDYAATRASVERALGARAARELDAFIKYAGKIWAVAERRFVLGDAPTLSSIASLGLKGLQEVSHLDAWSTMESAIERHVSSPHLRMLLSRYATYNGSDPRRAPATLNCIAHLELAEGAAAIRGGTFELVRALHRAAKRLGVEIELGAAVARIVLDGSSVCGVELADGRTPRAGIVIANADVAHVADHLLPVAKRRALPPVSEPSTSGYCMILRAERRPAGRRAAHTVLFPESYADEFIDLFDRDRPPAQPTVYLCAQELSHARKGWPLHEPLFVMVNAPAEPLRGERPPRVWRDLEEVILERLRRARLIERDDAVVWRRSPADLARRFPGSRGALYGAASNSWNAAFKRPKNVVSGVGGLYLASGSAHPGGGMPLAALSGMAAARSALRQAGVSPRPVQRSKEA